MKVNWEVAQRSLFSFPVKKTNQLNNTLATEAGYFMNGTVLLVENEVLIQEAIQDIFDMVGFRVIGAEDGSQGVALYQAGQDEIDLVILDARLPGMDGVEVLKRLRAINPSVRVIVSSGVDEKEIVERFKDLLPVPLLRKPYNARKLLAKVQSVLTAH